MTQRVAWSLAGPAGELALGVIDAIDEVQPSGQRCLPDGQRLGVVLRGIPAAQLLHRWKLNHVDSLSGRPAPLGYLRLGSANDVRPPCKAIDAAANSR